MWTGGYGLWRVVRVHAVGTDPDASREMYLYGWRKRRGGPRKCTAFSSPLSYGDLRWWRSVMKGNTIGSGWLTSTPVPCTAHCWRSLQWEQPPREAPRPRVPSRQVYHLYFLTHSPIFYSVPTRSLFIHPSCCLCIAVSCTILCD